VSSSAAILTVGDELILGDRIDTNGPWISRTLLVLGIETTERCSVGDTVDEIAKAIQRLAEQNDLVFVTGGLGPTEDDRTRQALAQAMGEDLMLDSDALESINSWFALRGATKPSANDVQAFRPKSASWAENLVGTAPGLWAVLENCKVFCLPGPPSELKPMFAAIQETILAGICCGIPRKTVELHAWGMPESIAGEKIADLMRLADPTVAILMGQKGITARVTSADQDSVKQMVAAIKERWSPWLYGCDDESLAYSISTLAEGSLATAESCTAGLLSDAIVQTDGASNWFSGGWVTYANEMKQSQLGVSSELLEKAGAVSYDVAKAMSEGAVSCSDARCGLSTTGVAGPDGGTTEKPVGTVFIGCTVETDTEVREFRFTGNRNEIRRRAASTALQMLRLRLLGIHVDTMCWQHGEAKL
jgi:nicotinamide-nucleotide amidase